VENKGGYIGIWKLIFIILLVIVMAIIVYGLTTGGLNPLLESVKGRLDNTLISLKGGIHFFSPEPTCEARFVKDLIGDDSTFFQDIGLSSKEASEATFKVCEGYCEIDLSEKEKYKLSGYLYKCSKDDCGNDWQKESGYLVGSNVGKAKEYQKIYSAFYEALGEDREIVKRYYDNLYTKRFVLYGDGDGGNDAIWAIWEDNHWSVFWVDDSVEFVGMNNKYAESKGYPRLIGQFSTAGGRHEENTEALNLFYSVVYSSNVFSGGSYIIGDDDEVYYDVMLPLHSDDVSDEGEFERNRIDGIVGGNSELDKPSELTTLISYVRKNQTDFYEDVYNFATSNYVLLGSVVDGKTFLVNGRDYTMEVGYGLDKEGKLIKGPVEVASDSYMQDYFPEIYLSEGGIVRYILSFDATARAFYGYLNDYQLNHLSLKLRDADVPSDIVPEMDYKLNDGDFATALRLSEIKNFLEDICSHGG